MAIAQNPDMELVALFTRRDPNTVKTASGVPVYASYSPSSSKEYFITTPSSLCLFVLLCASLPEELL